MYSIIAGCLTLLFAVSNCFTLKPVGLSTPDKPLAFGVTDGTKIPEHGNSIGTTASLSLDNETVQQSTSTEQGFNESFTNQDPTPMRSLEGPPEKSETSSEVGFGGETVEQITTSPESGFNESVSNPGQMTTRDHGETTRNSTTPPVQRFDDVTVQPNTTATELGVNATVNNQVSLPARNIEGRKDHAGTLPVISLDDEIVQPSTISTELGVNATVNNQFTSPARKFEGTTDHPRTSTVLRLDDETVDPSKLQGFGESASEGPTPTRGHEGTTIESGTPSVLSLVLGTVQPNASTVELGFDRTASSEGPTLLRDIEGTSFTPSAPGFGEKGSKPTRDLKVTSGESGRQNALGLKYTDITPSAKPVADFEGTLGKSDPPTSNMRDFEGTPVVPGQSPDSNKPLEEPFRRFGPLYMKILGDKFNYNVSLSDLKVRFKEAGASNGTITFNQGLLRFSTSFEMMDFEVMKFADNSTVGLYMIQDPMTVVQYQYQMEISPSQQKMDGSVQAYLKDLEIYAPMDVAKSENGTCRYFGILFIYLEQDFKKKLHNSVFNTEHGFGSSNMTLTADKIINTFIAKREFYQHINSNLFDKIGILNLISDTKKKYQEMMGQILCDSIIFPS